MAQPTDDPPDRGAACAPDAGEIFRDAAVQLALMTTTWETLLREHVRTPTGHCAGPTCGRPGYGTSDWQVHPCGVRALAEHARALHRAAEQSADQSSAGSPSAPNRSGPKVVISRMRPPSTLSTSSLKGRKIVSPGRHR
jgi:hypothetical protein